MLGEFGGLGLPFRGHAWRKQRLGIPPISGAATNLTPANMRPPGRIVCGLKVQARLCAAVYTQTTDVETEVNGLMTYYRAAI